MLFLLNTKVLKRLLQTASFSGCKITNNKNTMHKILITLVYTVPQALNRVLLKSRFLLCLNAFLRIGVAI